MAHPLLKVRSAQLGVVLVSSLLILLVVTIMVMSIFRSLGLQERIAGNVREKQRALQAAVSTQQYAEWWLATNSFATVAVGTGIPASADVICNSLIDANLNSGVPGGQICSNTLAVANSLSATAWTTTWPAMTTDFGVQYTPPNMNVGTKTYASVNDIYYKRPRFYIYDMGSLASARGEVYKIDAYSFGLNATGVALVESTVALVCVVCNLGGV